MDSERELERDHAQELQIVKQSQALQLKQFRDVKNSR